MFYNQLSYHYRRNRGFTLIEVLVVVAIIALLISILLPSLSRAREQARRAKCLSNMSTLGKAVMSFSVSHKGRGQLFCRADNAKSTFYASVDPTKTLYAYERPMEAGRKFKDGEPMEIRHKSWPAAYAPELGYTSLKHTDQYFVDEGPSGDYVRYFPETQKPEWFWNRFGKYEAFYCPSDKLMIRDSWSPDHDIGVMSYAVNEDIFGATAVTGLKTIARGASGNKKDRLIGRLDGIIRASDVAMFTDMGHDQAEQVMVTRNSGDALNTMIPVYDSFYTGGDTNIAHRASYLDGVARWVVQAFPVSRHGVEGGLSVAFADGHATFISGAGGLIKLDGSANGQFNGRVASRCLDAGKPISIVRTYIPNPPRVTPFNPLNR